MKLKSDFRGMPCRLAGASGLWMSVLGLGLWRWGEPSRDGSKVDFREGSRILDRALHYGVFHWDTAPSYFNYSGGSETLLGKYFSERPPSTRDAVIVATKVRNPAVPPAEVGPHQMGSSRRFIIRSVDDSLRRLQTDWIDLLYLHAPVLNASGDLLVPPEETWGTMDDLITAGKVRYLGVSNHSVAQIQTVMAALAAVRKDSSRRVVAVQNRYNARDRSGVGGGGDGGDAAFLRFCSEQGLSLVPHSPFAGGDLVRGASTNLHKDSGADPNRVASPLDRALSKVGEAAQQKGVSLSRLHLAWLFLQPAIASVIAGITRLAQLEDNVEAVRLELTDEELAAIENIEKAALAPAGPTSLISTV